MIVPVTKAATCQDIAGERVCLPKIKRSAKNYWEYRVTFNVDGIKQPPRVYNCRDRYYTISDSIRVYYKQNDKLSKLVCRLYN